jgi:hypothetical protein
MSRLDSFLAIFPALLLSVVSYLSKIFLDYKLWPHKFLINQLFLSHLDKMMSLSEM